jgi:glycerol-3-phosphate cytidylyltransferase
MELFDKIANLKKDKKTIGFTASTADLNHAGLMIMLQELKRSCDFVIFGLLSDPTIDRPESKNFPVETLFERWIKISSCKYVDAIVPFSTEKDLENMLKTLKPDIRFVGKEYENLKHTGKDISYIKIIYNDRDHDFSSSDLRRRVYEAEKNKLSE